MALIKRSVKISGHASSITLEPEFLDAITDIASKKGMSLNQLVSDIDAVRGDNNLSSAIRVYVLKTLSNAKAD